MAKTNGERDELVDFAEGRYAPVSLIARVAKQFAKAEARDRARIQNIMKMFSADGNSKLTKEQFRWEGRFHVGDKKGSHVQIGAFKSRQVRIYGGYVEAIRKFVCSEIDLKKKRNKADQDKLRRAAQNLAQFFEPE